MAIITAQAKFYNAFKCRVVDKNITANLSASFTMAHPDPTDPSGSSPGALPVTVLRSDNNALRVNAGLSMTGSYAIKGGLIKGNQSMTVTSRLRLQFSTFVEIDWYKLEIPEGKNVTIQMEEGFVIEDRNKFPFALGSPLAFNGNLLSFRTPKRGFVTPINSAFTLPNVAYTRVRFTQAVLTSAFSPTLVGQLNRLGIIDLQSAFQQTTIAGKIKFFASQMLARFGPIGPGDLPYLEGNGFQFQTGLGFWPQGFPGITRIRSFASDVESTFNSTIIGEDARLMAADLNLTSTMDVEGDKFKGLIDNLPLLSTVSVLPNAKFSIFENINSTVQMVPNTTQSLIRGISSDSFAELSLSASVRYFQVPILVTGNNSSGQLGLGDFTQRLIPTEIIDNQRWRRVDAGENHTLAINFSGELWAWGNNDFGQLGNGTTNSTNIPVRIGSASDWVEISAGGNHSLARNSLNEVYSWGLNSSGQLGVGDTTNRSTPTRVGTQTFTVIKAGGNFSVARNPSLSSTQQWQAWGNNDFGQLGWTPAQVPTPRTTPIQIRLPSDLPPNTTFSSVDTGGTHALGIIQGIVYSWGDNANGKLGLGDTTQRSIPTQVTTSNLFFTRVAAGGNHSLARTSDGLGDIQKAIFSWGLNSNGQLGLGDTTNRLSPTQIPQFTTSAIFTVKAGTNHSLASNNITQIWSWGNNANGRTGLNTATGNTLTPTEINNSINWAVDDFAFDAGGSHSVFTEFRIL